MVSFGARRIFSILVQFVCFIPLICSAAQHVVSPITQLAKLEATSGNILGVAAIDMNTHQRIDYHATTRFPMGCTSKVVAVAAILQKSAGNTAYLQHTVHYRENDILDWAPITKQHVADGMTIAQLCAAAISFSDNTAMNLLVKQLGGLQAINAFARSIGDHAFQLDHGWPQEAWSNIFTAQDSSTPAAMQDTLQKLVFGNVLLPSARAQLKTWLIQNTTGNTRIRAGVPDTWVVGDKTGTGFEYGTANDIAIIWPPHCAAPLILAIYTTSTRKDAPKREDLIRSATRLLVHDFAQQDRCMRV